MIFTDIARIRLASQQIAGTTLGTVKDMVAWMGAMQAQDYPMAKWALGVRLPGSTDQVIEAALDAGEIIRTHLLRPTWHFVSADDVYWLLELTAPHIKASIKSRHKELELSEAILAKSNVVIGKAFRDQEHLTREQIKVELEKAQIATDNNRLSHLLLWAELEGIVCSGAVKGGKQTYALLEARVPKTRSLTKEEALAALAQKYFASHCPATLHDFTWWSGLSAGDAKRALEMVKADFISETIASQTYWLPGSYSTSPPGQEAAVLLPAYDEFIISYRDRSTALSPGSHSKTISENGLFRPVIVVNGQVMGIWKRAIKKDQVMVETELFEQLDQTTQGWIEKASLHYARFLEKKLVTSQ